MTIWNMNFGTRFEKIHNSRCYCLNSFAFRSMLLFMIKHQHQQLVILYLYWTSLTLSVKSGHQMILWYCETSYWQILFSGMNWDDFFFGFFSTMLWMSRGRQMWWKYQDQYSFWFQWNEEGRWVAAVLIYQY